MKDKAGLVAIEEFVRLKPKMLLVIIRLEKYVKKLL